MAEGGRRNEMRCEMATSTRDAKDEEMRAGGSRISVKYSVKGVAQGL